MIPRYRLGPITFKGPYVVAGLGASEWALAVSPLVCPSGSAYGRPGPDRTGLSRLSPYTAPDRRHHYR